MNLNSPIREIKGIGVKTEQLFQQLGVYTVGRYTPIFPRDYEKYPALCEVEQVIRRQKKCPLYLREKVSHRKYPFPPAGGTFGRKRRNEGTASDLVSQSLYPFPDPPRRLVCFLWKSKPEEGRLVMEQPQIFSLGQYEALQKTLQPHYSLTKGITNI